MSCRAPCPRTWGARSPPLALASQLCSEASIGTGAGFTRVQPPGAKTCTLVTLMKNGLDDGKREGDILWSQEKCGRTEGYLSRLLPPGLTVQEAGPFLPEAGATNNVHRAAAFPRGFPPSRGTVHGRQV